MAKIHCFYNCGAVESIPSAMEKHYQQFHAKFKAYYWRPGFTCDSCQHYQANSLLYSPAPTQAQLNQNPHYCGKCANQNPPLKSPSKPKIMNKRNLSSKKKKILKSKLKPKKKKTFKKSVIKTTTLALRP